MNVLILVMAMLVIATNAYSQEFYIEDCSGHMHKPHEQEDYPKNVKWFVYWYRESNGVHWGKNEYSSAQRAIEAMKYDMKRCGDCLLCDRELWCNAKLVAKEDCVSRSSNNNPFTGAGKQQFLNWLTQARKSFKEYIKPSFGGSIRNVGEVTHEYNRVLNEARNQLNELKNKNLPQYEINELENELRSFETDIYLIKNEHARLIMNGGFEGLNKILDDFREKIDEGSGKSDKKNQNRRIYDDSTPIGTETEAIEQQFLNWLPEELKSFEMYIISSNDSRGGNYLNVQKESDRLLEEAELKLLEARNKLIKIYSKNLPFDEFLQLERKYLRQLEEKHNIFRNEIIRLNGEYYRNIVEKRIKDLETAKTIGIVQITTPTYKVEPNSFNFKAFLADKKKLDITGFSSYSGNLKIYIDSDLISEQSIESGNFSISFNVSKKYNSGNRSVKILIDAANQYFQQTVILLRK